MKFIALAIMFVGSSFVSAIWAALAVGALPGTVPWLLLYVIVYAIIAAVALVVFVLEYINDTWFTAPPLPSIAEIRNRRTNVR